jgi:hypothetical protein
MGNRKSSHKSRKPVERSNVAKAESTTERAVTGDLRTAHPVVKVRACVARLREGVDKVCKRLAGWVKQNESVGDASNSALELVNAFPALEDALEELEHKGFSPERTTYTASAEEGDVVSVLDKFREKYEDIMPPSSMAHLTVLKKYPGRGGGLIVESTDEGKMKVASSHVVKL